MATSSITANFYCDDAKAANAFVRMLARPVKSVSLGSDVARAHVFATENERKAFCANTVRAARRHKAEKLWVFGSCARKEERPPRFLCPMTSRFQMCRT